LVTSCFSIGFVVCGLDLRKIGDSPWVGLLLGAAFFLAVFGLRILEPTYIAWQLTDDPAHLYLGWEYFRHEPWQFPFGKLAGYGTPEGSSIFYTDSIPIAALFFKCIRWALPQPFQYTGLWILLSYILQGVFGWLLSALNTQSRYCRMLMTCLFVLSPSMLERSNRHIALVTHWIPLAAIYLGLLGAKQFELRHPNWSWRCAWTLLLVASGLVHLYICFMVVVIYLSAVGVFAATARWRKARTYWSLSLPPIALLVALYLEGGFVVGPQGWTSGAGQFSLFSMNALSPFMPTHFDNPESAAHASYFFDSIKVPNAGYHEGFNYLGLGTLGLLALALPVLAGGAVLRGQLARPAEDERQLLSFGPQLATWIACLSLAGLSLSNEIHWGLERLASYHMGPTLQRYADIFRSSGRFFWPLGYLLLWLGMRSSRLLAAHRVNLQVTVLHAAVTLQLLDSSELIKQYEKSHATVVHFDTPFKSQFWATTIPHFKDIFYYPSYDITYYVQLGVLAAPHGVGINVVFKPRSNPDGDHGESRRLEEGLRAGTLRSGTLYIFKDKALLAELRRRLPQGRYILREVDGFCVAGLSAVHAGDNPAPGRSEA
jgi:hypothetical protein